MFLPQRNIFSIFTPSVTFGLGQSVPEVFYSAYLQNNVAFRASFLREVGSCKNGFPSAKASAFRATHHFQLAIEPRSCTLDPRQDALRDRLDTNKISIHIWQQPHLQSFSIT
jgi:hypothetical protein